MTQRIPLLLALTALLAAGCERDAIRVYLAPKDPVASSGAPDGERSRAQLTWTLPPGWQETDPGKVSLANFVIKTAQGEASVNVTPLPNMEGHEGTIVNMWREQVGQAPLTAEEITAGLTPVEVAGATGKLFEVGGNGKRRIVTAMQHQENTSWFFKLAGDEAVVTAQKPVFLEFIKSVRIKEPAAHTEAVSPPQSRQFQWAVPEQWQAVPPGEMQIAKFAVPPRGGAMAEVTVSIFPNDTGGTLANVNRWRKQIGLPEIGEADLAKIVQPLDAAPNGAILVDLASASRRLVGAIVPRGSQWFFYKLLGDAEVVTAERDAFIRFASSQP